MSTAMGRFDARCAPKDWGHALGWALFCARRRPIAEIQIWAHGKWGEARIGSHILDARTLAASHPLAAVFKRLRASLAPEAVIWFRTCATFGAVRGQEFGRIFADALGCRTAGHTHNIDIWQSGLHSIAPGTRARWDPNEGLAVGTPELPFCARESSPAAPNTIMALEMSLPRGF